MLFEGIFIVLVMAAFVGLLLLEHGLLVTSRAEDRASLTLNLSANWWNQCIAEGCVLNARRDLYELFCDEHTDNPRRKVAE